MPAELEEAARLDGANPFQVFWRVMLPLARAVDQRARHHDRALVVERAALAARRLDLLRPHAAVGRPRDAHRRQDDRLPRRHGREPARHGAGADRVHRAAAPGHRRAGLQRYSSRPAPHPEENNETPAVTVRRRSDAAHDVAVAAPASAPPSAAASGRPSTVTYTEQRRGDRQPAARVLQAHRDPLPGRRLRVRPRSTRRRSRATARRASPRSCACSTSRSSSRTPCSTTRSSSSCRRTTTPPGRPESR